MIISSDNFSDQWVAFHGFLVLTNRLVVSTCGTFSKTSIKPLDYW